MKPLHKIVLVSTTFVLAAATGHVMQNSERFGLGAPPAAPEAAQTPELQLAAATAEAGAQPVLPAAQEPGPVPGLPVLPPLQTPAFATPDALPGDAAAPTAGFGATTCAPPQLTTAPAPLASVQLTLTAPCFGNATVTLTHAGLALPLTLSAEGGWSGVVPAMATPAAFSVTFADGTQVAATETVSGLEAVNRIALVSQATAGLFLHGFEYGSDYGGAGDVSLFGPRDAATTLGGWMAGFSGGNAEDDVQIYTAPADMGDIRLALEAAVDPGTCGQDVRAEARRLLKGVAEASAVITLAMPACNDADGAVLMPLPDFPMALASAN